MKSVVVVQLLSLVIMGLPWTLQAQNVPYTDEAAFLRALLDNGLVAVHEGFEDDDAWGAVRSGVVGGTHAAPSVTHLDVTWTSSSENNQITTGSGPARTGSWGFFSVPHADYENGISQGG